MSDAAAVFDRVWVFAAVQGGVLLTLVLMEIGAVLIVSARRGLEARASGRGRSAAFGSVLKLTAAVNVVTLAAGAGLAWLVGRAWASAPGVVTGNPVDRMVVSWKLSPHEGVVLAAGLVALTALVEWAALEAVRWRRLRRAGRSGGRRRSANGSTVRRFIDQLSMTPERRFGVVLAVNAASMPVSWEIGALIARSVA